MKQEKQIIKFVVCIKNEGYEVSLEKRKIYPVVPDAGAEKKGLIRMIDESGQDYLYPEQNFVPIELPQQIVKALDRAA